MEGISACVMGDIKLLGIVVVPTAFLLENLEDTSGRVIRGSSGSYSKSADNFPFPFTSFKYSTLLCVMADPDKVFCFAGKAFVVYIGEFYFFVVLLGSVFTISLVIADGSDLGCEETCAVLFLVFGWFYCNNVGSVRGLVSFSSIFGKCIDYDIPTGAFIEIIDAVDQFFCFAQSFPLCFSGFSIIYFVRFCSFSFFPLDGQLVFCVVNQGYFSDICSSFGCSSAVFV